MTDVRFGTCGFSYKDWVGPFYPEGMKAGDYLAHYATRFDTVELNATFYRLPALKSLESMVAKTPPGFTFVVKAHRSLTHEPPADLSLAVEAFNMALRPFATAGKLGGVLLQFPYAFQPVPANRERLARLAGDLAGDAPVVVEFRHRAWFRDDFLDGVRKHGLSLCCVDEPALPGLPPPVALVTGPVGYLRFHGRNQEAWWAKEGEGAERDAGARYRYDYSTDEMKEWVPRVRDLTAAPKGVFVFFNNHPDGHAARNALTFRELLGPSGPSGTGEGQPG